MLLGEPQQPFASPGEALAHYGVKGQRKGHGTPKRIDRKNGRDPKRLAILYGRRRGKKEPIEVQSKMADHVNQKVGAVNKKYEAEDFSNADWNDPSTWPPKVKEYHTEVLALTAEADRKTIKDVYGVTPTANRRAELDATNNRLEIREVKIQHAANDDDVVAIFQVIRDSSGLIIEINPLTDDNEQGET